MSASNHRARAAGRQAGKFRNTPPDFKTLVEHSPDAISRIDRALRHLYVNPAFETNFGLPALAYAGASMAELGCQDNMVRVWEQAAQQVFTDGRQQRIDFAIGEGAQSRHFTARLIPEQDGTGEIVSVLGIAYDVSAQRRLENEYAISLARQHHARIQAEKANHARDEFLSIVSHELRAPLNGIQSWAYILEHYVAQTASPPLAQRAVNGIKIGIAQQAKLIEDLLDVTRMVSGTLQLVRQPLACLPALQNAATSVGALAAAKHITLHRAFQLTTEQVNGDAVRMQQLLWNLLSNAIKFTPDGGNIWFAAEPADSSVRVTVRDDGAGVSAAFIPHLFERFSQEDTSSTRGHAGLGLSLFLVRQLVELHGGRITVDSRGEGQGTCFAVYLPQTGAAESTLFATRDDQEKLSLPCPALHGKRILLIDDQAEAREALSVVLDAAGAAVFAAASCREAINWLQTLALHELPEMMICDCAMSGEDGYTTLRNIRTWQAGPNLMPLQRLPAMALTVFSQREDQLRALTAGFQMHMSKPVVPDEFLMVVANMMPPH